MSESSTEKVKTPEDLKSETEEVTQESKKEPKLVPQEAVAKARADKRAAREEANVLRKDNERRDEFDEDLINQLAQQAKEAVDKEMAPMRAENARLKMAVDHGLNGEQAEAVMDFQSKNPALTIEQSMTLARSERQDLFPQQTQLPAHLRGLPASGDSQARAATDKSDFTRLMHEARAGGDVGEAQRNAALAFEQRFQMLRNSAR